HHRRPDQAAQVDVRTESPQLDRALEREHHPGKEAGQKDDRDGADADAVHLDQHVGRVERARRHEAHRPLAQDEILLHAERSVAHPGVDRGDESPHRVQQSARAGRFTRVRPRGTFSRSNGSGGSGDESSVPSLVSQVVNRISPGRLDALLEAFREVRVVVVGDLMLDVYLRGSASRVSPEAPVPVVRISEEWVALGGAANVADNVVALGAACDVVGCIGTDRHGERLREELRASGIHDAGVLPVEGRPTTVKTRVLARHHQVARYDVEVEDDVDAESAGALIAAIERLLDDADALVLEDYNTGVLVPQVIEAAIAAANRQGIPVVVDPKYRN